jgi:outer membrane protein TolC
MKIIKIRQENLELGKKQLEKIRAQYNAGIVSIGNVYAQDAELGNQEYDLITTENELENAKSKLLATMGLQPDIDAEFLESSLPTEVDENELLNFRKSIGSYGAAVNNALKNRFDFNAYIESVESAKNSITIAQSGYFPKLYTTLGWQSSGTKFDDLDKTDRTYLNLNLSIPIFENFDANYNIQNAQLTLTQQETELKRLEQNIRSSVRISFLNLEAAEKQIDLTNRTLKSSLENYNSTKQRFDVGAANITELFAANNQMIISQINRINSVYNYIKAQKYALYVTGLL